MCVDVMNDENNIFAPHLVIGRNQVAPGSASFSSRSPSGTWQEADIASSQPKQTRKNSW